MEVVLTMRQKVKEDTLVTWVDLAISSTIVSRKGRLKRDNLEVGTSYD